LRDGSPRSGAILAAFLCQFSRTGVYIMGKKLTDEGIAESEAIASWRQRSSKPYIQCKTSGLSDWLALPIDDRIGIALTILDHLCAISEEMPEDQRYITIGTTQNKSSFVFTLKGGNVTSSRKFAEYDNDFVELLKSAALTLEEIISLDDSSF